MNPNNQSDQDTDLPHLPTPQNPQNSTGGGSGHSKKSNPAADLIRQKLTNIYDDAPKASKELEEISTATKPLSKHQLFVANLRKDGKSMAEIQEAWNYYYEDLPDHEKHQVWQEFYSANKLSPANIQPSHDQPHYVSAPFAEEEQPAPKVIKQRLNKRPTPHVKPKTADEVKKRLLKNVEQHSKKRWFRSLHSLAFGLFMGFLVVFLFLFSFFNDRFLAPFITPSRNVSAEALIVDPSAPVGPAPLIIIPKINVELPVVYTVPTIDENTIETALETGVVHYPTTAYPGQLGNGAIFGHSSNNILNPGQYKFAFVLLHDLVPGDTFTLNYQSKAYVYQVISKSIVSPNDTSVLNNIAGKPATFTLITCDPPGTSINRLVVVGVQISPDPSTDTASNVNQNTAAKPSVLPSNSPSLWGRIVKALGI